VIIEATREQVFDVLVDPTTYPEWLVGAQRIRSVDPDWPRPGSEFRHRIGVGPLAVPGSTTIRRLREPHELVLAAGMGPFGEAAVRFVLDAVADGTEATIEEEPAKGVARVAWRGSRSLVSAALWGRNAVSLASLARTVRQRVDGSAESS
jgi:uncharacterized protein YndB with AHSA1/START domain